MKSYNLRGTNGSGKTFVARELLKLSNAKPSLFLGKKVRAYQGKLFDAPFYILGSYETQCGGCDTISDVATVAELLRMYMTGFDDNRVIKSNSAPGIVFFEGLMISHMLGTVGAMQTKLGKDNNVLAFLNTPLDVCIQRVERRRKERGDDRPFDPKNVIKDWPRVQSCKEKAIREKYRVSTVFYDKAVENVLEDLQQLSKGVL